MKNPVYSDGIGRLISVVFRGRMRKSFLEKEFLFSDEKYARCGMISLCFKAGLHRTRLPDAAAAAASAMVSTSTAVLLVGCWDPGYC